jgi:hypothetical protein
MSLPNPAVPRLSYAVSRRCARRCFFLRPSPKTNRVFGYCLGYALDRSPTVRLTAFMVHVNHYHMVISADDASLAEFFALLNSLLARAMNCHLGRGENFWAPGGTPRVGIFDEEALWEQLVYCTINPTKDGLIETPEAWPGLLSLPEDVEAKTFRFQRPDKFFRSEGEEAMPEWVEFELVRPVELEDMDLDAFRTEYRRRLDEAVARVHAERAAAGKGFMGAQLVRDRDPMTAAGDTFPDRDLTPRVACKDKRRRRGVLRWISEFRLAHTIAWFFWSRGDRNVIFPAHTYLMRARYGVRCRDPVNASPDQAVALAA